MYITCLSVLAYETVVARGGKRATGVVNVTVVGSITIWGNEIFNIS